MTDNLQSRKADG